jgi:hypothetical protein
LKPLLRLALCLFVIPAVIATFSSVARGQQVDLAVGGSSMFAPSGSQAIGDHEPQSMDGGVYPSVSGDYLFFHKHIGAEAEYSWRWNNSTYLPGYVNLPYKNLFYDFNAVWVSQPIRKKFNVEVLGGAGVASTRFYLGSCSSTNCYGSTNHFMVDFGGGIKYYVWRHFFVRPEGRYYLINNNIDFSSNHAVRYGASIGYTFR